MNDNDRSEWIDNDEGLNCLWKASKLSKRAFIKQRRRHIDAVIGTIMSRKQPAHYLLYGPGRGKTGYIYTEDERPSEFFTPAGKQALAELLLQEKLMGPDRTKEGIFQDHNCWKCRDGQLPCVAGHPRNCEYPRARND